MKSLTPHASKQFVIVSWFHTNDIPVHSSDPKFTHLPDANLFSKEHVISGSHPDNVVCRWDPLDPPKSDPSDPDCPGHPTHALSTLENTFEPADYMPSVLILWNLSHKLNKSKIQKEMFKYIHNSCNHHGDLNTSVNFNSLIVH